MTKLKDAIYKTLDCCFLGLVNSDLKIDNDEQIKQLKSLIDELYAEIEEKIKTYQYLLKPEIPGHPFLSCQETRLRYKDHIEELQSILNREI